MDGRVTSPPALGARSLSTKSDSWAPQTRNPVSVRLYKVLGTNYDDEGTKQALRTLSDFYAPAPPAGVTTASARDEDDDDDWEDDEPSTPNVHARVASAGHETVAASAPAPVIGELASRARNNMRRDVDRKLAEGSRKFLDAFRDVDQVCVLSLHDASTTMYLVLNMCIEFRRSSGTDCGYEDAVWRRGDATCADERVVR